MNARLLRRLAPCLLNAVALMVPATAHDTSIHPFASATQQADCLDGEAPEPQLRRAVCVRRAVQRAPRWTAL